MADRGGDRQLERLLVVLKLQILVRASGGIAFSAAGARRLIGEAGGFCLFECCLLDQDSLALVASTGTAEPHNHS